MEYTYYRESRHEAQERIRRERAYEYANENGLAILGLVVEAVVFVVVATLWFCCVI